MLRLRRHNAVSSAEIGALVAAATADTTARGARDAAAIALLWGVGLVPEQIALLDSDDFDAEEGRLRVFKNTGAERWLHLADDTAVVLRNWLLVRGPHRGPLFHPILRSDRIVVRRLSKINFSGILARRAEEAGVAPFSPDDLARTQTFLVCGQWEANSCCLVPTDRQQFPITDPKSVRLRKARSLDSAADLRRLAVEHYLWHLMPRERTGASEILGELAKVLGGANAFMLPWERLSAGDL